MKPSLRRFLPSRRWNLTLGKQLQLLLTYGSVGRACGREAKGETAIGRTKFKDRIWEHARVRA